MATELELAWAAGILDGEGCVYIQFINPKTNHKNGLRNPSYRMGVKVTMGDAPTIHRLHEIMGVGSFQNHKGRGDRINASFSWMAMSRKAEIALLALQPYVVTKSPEIAVALEFMSLPDVQRGGKNGSPPINRELLKQKHELYIKCAQLKPRYRFRKTIIEPEPTYR